MLQANPATWNKIAATQALETTWAADLFGQAPDELVQAVVDEEEKLARKLAVRPTVAMVLIKMGALLWERKAIARYLQSHPQDQAALPNLESVDEAMDLVKVDHPTLTPAEQTKLREMLRRPPI